MWMCEASLLHADRSLLHAGLVSAVEMLQPIKDQVPNVSWADLMQMASALAVEDAGGPKIDMRYGREDCPTEDLKAADGVLPGEVSGFRAGSSEREHGSMILHAGSSARSAAH